MDPVKLMKEYKKKYLGGKEASKLLGVHQRTLYLWEKSGLIKTFRCSKRGKRFYDVEKFLKQKNPQNIIKGIENLDDLDKKDGQLNISYARVSTLGQKEDLERQKEMLKNKYPKHLLIEDIGSGINLNRRGLRKIIKLAIAGKIKQLVVAYKDRLTRFGFELIEDLIKDYSKGEIIIINKKDDLEPEEELANDVLQIMNVFSAKLNGLRKNKNKDQRDKLNIK
jgi:predicted site-specific integrase-resolvase